MSTFWKSLNGEDLTEADETNETAVATRLVTTETGQTPEEASRDSLPHSSTVTDTGPAPAPTSARWKKLAFASPVALIAVAVTASLSHHAHPSTLSTKHRTSPTFPAVLSPPETSAAPAAPSRARRPAAPKATTDVVSDPKVSATLSAAARYLEQRWQRSAGTPSAAEIAAEIQSSFGLNAQTSDRSIPGTVEVELLPNGTALLFYTPTSSSQMPAFASARLRPSPTTTP